MVEVEHNKGAYREWYKINEKKTHIRGFSIVEITKEFKCNSKNNSKLKLLKMCVIKGDATKSTDAYVKLVQKVSIEIAKGMVIYATTKLMRYYEDFQQLVFEKFLGHLILKGMLPPYMVNASNLNGTMR